jgi:hypothetical protein
MFFWLPSRWMHYVAGQCALLAAVCDDLLLLDPTAPRRIPLPGVPPVSVNANTTSNSGTPPRPGSGSTMGGAGGGVPPGRRSRPDSAASTGSTTARPLSALRSSSPGPGTTSRPLSALRSSSPAAGAGPGGYLSGPRPGSRDGVATGGARSSSGSQDQGKTKCPEGKAWIRCIPVYCCVCSAPRVLAGPCNTLI